MLAKEVAQPFNSKEWLYEIKWDGYRAIAEVKNQEVKLYSRNGNSFASVYAVIAEELSKIKERVVLDGEVVVLDEKGKSDFQKLQSYEMDPNVPLYYYAFDILSYKNKSTLDLPLIERKELLQKLLAKQKGLIRYSDHILEKGIDFFKTAGKNDLEGIMAKKIDSKYHPGTRTGEWLKIKHHKTEDVIIVGFTEPTGARKYFGALVLAIEGKDGLQYVGHTGSGFSDQLLKELYEQFKPLITSQSPFKEKVKTNMPVTWLKPRYICEVKYTEWTSDHKMRHPIFLHLRTDKTIKDMITLPAKKASAKKIKQETAPETALSFGKIKFQPTHTDKIFWPDQEITKGMLIDYYQSAAEYILPYLKERPESLKRNPNGIKDNGFFHKDAGEAAPSWVKTKTIYSESAKKEIQYIICNDKATLAYLNNLGCIELNPWNSTIKALDKPDYMIIDIDPSEKNNFSQVVLAALEFKKLLDKAGAKSYCKTSGATGLHIYIPMGKKYSYEQVKNFAHILCTMVHEQIPGFTSMERNLQKRGNSKIYLDYLQNRRGQTIAAPYSLRPRDKATVSTPLQWKEVMKGLDPTSFTIDTILKRVKKIGDIFSPVLGTGIDLKKCIAKLS
jgi:bifunctional non-homologous end joining protein LigD